MLRNGANSIKVGTPIYMLPDHISLEEPTETSFLTLSASVAKTIFFVG